MGKLKAKYVYIAIIMRRLSNMSESVLITNSILVVGNDPLVTHPSISFFPPETLPLAKKRWVALYIWTSSGTGCSVLDAPKLVSPTLLKKIFNFQFNENPNRPKNVVLILAHSGINSLTLPT